MSEAEPKKTAVYRKESGDLWAFVYDFEVSGPEVVMVDVRSDSLLRPRLMWRMHVYYRRQECIDLMAAERVENPNQWWWPSGYDYGLDEKVFDIPDDLSTHTEAFARGAMPPGIYADALQDHWSAAPEAALSLLRRPYEEAN